MWKILTELLGKPAHMPDQETHLEDASTNAEEANQPISISPTRLPHASVSNITLFRQTQHTPIPVAERTSYPICYRV